MKEVRIEKAKLLEIVKKNRDEHRQVFLDAQVGYREKAVAALDRQLRFARDGNPFVLAEISALIAPVDHTDDYDRAIQMLELSVDETVTLEADDFRNLVQDRWDWTKQWSFANSNYTRSPKFI